MGGNSSAQAVLSAPALITSDGLGKRLCLYPAVSVDCHSACSQHLCMYICDRHFCSVPPWSGEYVTLLHYVHTVRMYLSYVLQVLMCVLHAFPCFRVGMLSTWLQRVAVSALFSPWLPRWSLCSTVLTSMVTPCCTMQLRQAMLQWCNLWSMTTSWTPVLVTRCVFRHAGILQRAVGPVVGCVMEGDMW